MKIRSLLVSLLALPAALFAGDAKNCGCACCKGKEVCCCHADAKSADTTPAPQLHPLTGVVTKVMADRGALMVKHDEIPGVMRAMTMMFLVEADVLARVKQGDAIKAQMGRNADNKWILRDVVVVAK
jgi:Cu/Ag efflux protein CusF